MNNTSALRYFISFLWTMAIPIVLGQQTNDFANSMQMLQLVNNARLQKNIRPLCLSEKLVRAATAHSAYQASINMMTHDGPVSLGDRFIKQGYQPSAVAENVGFTSTPFIQVVFDIWMSSPEHRANILDPNYVHFGAASSHGSNNMYFWTQLFAKPLNMAMEPCDFSAAATAAALTPGQTGFNPNGAWGGSSNYNAYTPSMHSSGNCVSIDNGINGKSLSCKLSGPATSKNVPNTIPISSGPNPAPMNSGTPFNNPAMGPNPAVATNPMINPMGPNVINNPPGYDGTSCTVVSTSPAPDGQGSVRVLKCKSNSPYVGTPAPVAANPVGPNPMAANHVATPNIPPSAQPMGDGSSIIINPNGSYNNPGFNSLPGYQANNPMPQPVNGAYSPFWN